MSHSSISRRRPQLPTWARWALSFGVAAALVVALVVFVDHHNGNGLATQSPAALARANREADIVVAQDQAPHVIRLRSGANPHAAFVRAVRDDMSRRINQGTIDGTLQPDSPVPAMGAVATRSASPAMRSSPDVNYPFVGVVHLTSRRLIYCKRDEPPVPSQNIPISSRCQA